MEKLTTGIKDVDWDIFMNLTDLDLLHVCQLNKKMKEFFNDDAFWEYRTKSVYSENIIKTKPPYLPWKAYYAMTRKTPHYTEDIYMDTTPPIFFVDVLRLIGDMKGNIQIGDITAVSKDKEETTETDYLVTDIKDNKVELHQIGYNKVDDFAIITFDKTSSSIIIQKGLQTYTFIFQNLIEDNEIKKLVIIFSGNMYETKDGIHFE